MPQRLVFVIKLSVKLLVLTVLAMIPAALARISPMFAMVLLAIVQRVGCVEPLPLSTTADCPMWRNVEPSTCPSQCVSLTNEQPSNEWQDKDSYIDWRKHLNVPAALREMHAPAT